MLGWSYNTNTKAKRGQGKRATYQLHQDVDFVFKGLVVSDLAFLHSLNSHLGS